MAQSPLATSFNEILDKRYSVRGFEEQAIPDDELQAIFEQAQRAPSNCNTQPWKVAVVSGDKLRQLGAVMQQGMAEFKMSMDFPYDGVYQDEFKSRQHGAAAALYDALGIAREDKEGRNVAFMKNFDCFGAPHAAFLFLPEQFGVREAADLGMYAQTLMLSLAAHGYGSCPQTALSFFADQVREATGVDAKYKLLFGISFGKPDADHPANRCRTDRASLDDTVTFCS